VAVIRICIDTTAYSRLMRGRPKLQERLEGADEILLPATALGELYAGFQASSMASNEIGRSLITSRKSAF
jgi:predicted nucleic acid-binding protein